MRVIHVARKPLSEGNVASNILKHGCGAINVDVSRISLSDGDSNFRLSPRICKRNAIYGDLSNKPPIVDNSRTESVQHSVKGRWPANLILQHKPGCECVGERKVKTAWSPAGKSSGKADRHTYGDLDSGDAGRQVQKHCDAEGNETIAAWNCTPDCPVAALDAGTDWQHTRGNCEPSSCWGGYSGGWKGVTKIYHLRGDLKVSGGASRFFKQVQGESE